MEKMSLDQRKILIMFLNIIVSRYNNCNIENKNLTGQTWYRTAPIASNEASESIFVTQLAFSYFNKFALPQVKYLLFPTKASLALDLQSNEMVFTRHAQFITRIILPQVLAKHDFLIQSNFFLFKSQTLQIYNILIIEDLFQDDLEAVGRL